MARRDKRNSKLGTIHDVLLRFQHTAPECTSKTIINKTALMRTKHKFFISRPRKIYKTFKFYDLLELMITLEKEACRK